MKTFPISEEFAAQANITPAEFFDTYQQSTESEEGNEAFWESRAELLDWYKKPTKIKNVNYNLDDFRIKWFEDGELNVAYNCIDRHLEDNPYKPAIIWEGIIPPCIASFRLKSCMQKCAV